MERQQMNGSQFRLTMPSKGSQAVQCISMSIITGRGLRSVSWDGNTNLPTANSISSLNGISFVKTNGSWISYFTHHPLHPLLEAFSLVSCLITLRGRDLSSSPSTSSLQLPSLYTSSKTTCPFHSVSLFNHSSLP